MKTSHSNKEIIRRRHKKQEKKRVKQQAKKRIRNRQKQENRSLVFMLHKTITHFFPELFDRIREIEDYRDNPEYELVEIILGCIAMFLFKEGSRNAFNNDRKEGKFFKNYRKIFKFQLPHMDTVDRVMRLLNEEELNKLNAELIQGLVTKKVLSKYRFLGKYYRVMVDGTHVMNVPDGHCESCLHKTSSKGKKTYFHNVLAAKLVCENGFCLSLANEWIENFEEEYDKQDCEQKAFARLADKLKEAYPRLPICIVADALYPNQTFLKICLNKEWACIVTFKDGNLKSVWEEVLSLKNITKNNTRNEIKIVKGKTIHRSYCWINDIDYKGIKVYWFECVEREEKKETRFVYLSSLNIDYFNVLEMTQTGRLRWKIENEGFNTQKNLGYGLKHKYSRVSFKATKNYYMCMQIAHIINQLFELGSLLAPLRQGKMTLKHLWKRMINEMTGQTLNIRHLQKLLECKVQIRFG